MPEKEFLRAQEQLSLPGDSNYTRSHRHKRRYSRPTREEAPAVSKIPHREALDIIPYIRFMGDPTLAPRPNSKSDHDCDREAPSTMVPLRITMSYLAMRFPSWSVGSRSEILSQSANGAIEAELRSHLPHHASSGSRGRPIVTTQRRTRSSGRPRSGRGT